MEQLQLLGLATGILEKAKEKGFEHQYTITPVMFEPSWMNPEEAFFNTVAAIVSMWLRSEGIFVCVAPAPRQRGQYSYFVNTGPGPQPFLGDFGGSASWEEAWAKGINEALNQI